MNDTIKEMRERVGKGRKPRRSFMKNTEVRDIRTKVLRVTQAKLAEQLIDPGTGMPISDSLVFMWEVGDRAVPLWAARHILALADAARDYDMKEGS